MPSEGCHVSTKTNKVFRPFHETVEAQAAIRPEAVAVEFGERRLSYAELQARSARLARRLAARGVGRGSTVALAVPPSPEAVTAVLAVLRAGAAWLPLDLDYPRERIEFMLRDSGTTLILADAAGQAALPSLELPIVAVTDGDEDEDAQGYESSAVGPEDLAYVIYTSGSTGRPKGVMLTHGGLANLADAQAEVFEVRAEDRVLQFASWSFDASVFELSMALFNGATLVLPPSREIRFGPGLADFPRRCSRCSRTPNFPPCTR
jgi:non-ribosomal peptide synthetase component F